METLCQKVEAVIAAAETPTDKAWAAIAVMQAHRLAFTEQSATAETVGSGVLREAGQFLVDRIADLEWSDDGYDALVRNWFGHVEPALDRFKAALSATEDTPA